MIKIPPYLKKGNCIGLVCPSGFMAYEKAKTCIEVLQQWGYKVKVGTTVGGKQKNYFAGTDAERLHDLQTMLDDDSVHAVLCARGGYGMSRIIDTINFNKFKTKPKWIIGFSDITVLHAHINTKLKIATLHAPMAAAFNDDEFKNEYVQSLQKALKGIHQKYVCNTHLFNKTGKASGELVGGNLSLIAHLIGSKSSFQTKNKILFIEDVGEYVYNVDRMFIQLKRAGMLQNLAGLIIGGFTEMKDTTAPFGKNVYDVLHEHISEYKYPVCFNFPVSHDKENYALKIGAMYELYVATKNVQLKEIK